MISIIIPTLNEESKVEELFKNILLLPGDFEAIIIDGGSTDKTLEIIPENIKIFQTEKGRSTQLNRGAKEAKGDILLFLHADTTLPVNAVEAVEDVINKGYIGGRFKVKLDEKGLIYRFIERGINTRDRFTGGSTGDQALFVKKEIFNEIKGFKQIPICEDLDFARRLKRKGKCLQLPFYVETSARRWKNSGPIRMILLMWLIRLGYLFRFPPVKLKKLYGELR